jgi:hypothetical protein
MTRDEYIICLADKVASEEIDFSHVRKELKRHGLNEADTKSMIRLIDDEVQGRAVEKAKRGRRNSYVLVGTLMTIAGLICIISFMGAGPLVYFIGYGPFTTGIGLLVAGRRAYSGTLRIRNQRVAGSFRSRLNV